MKMIKNNNKTVIIVSGGQGTTCPRVSITTERTKLVDDYYGKLKIRKSLLKKIFE